MRRVPAKRHLQSQGVDRAGQGLPARLQSGQRYATQAMPSACSPTKQQQSFQKQPTPANRSFLARLLRKRLTEHWLKDVGLTHESKIIGMGSIRGAL